MAVQDYRNGAAAVPANMSGIAFRLENTLDFATTNLANGDIAKVFDIPAGTLVLSVCVDVTTAETTGTIDVGDYTISTGAAVDADGYLDDLDISSTGETCSYPGTLTEGTPNVWNEALAQGKFYKTAVNFIGVLANAALDEAILTVRAVCLKYR